jgi:hypothetical protein
VLTTPLDLLSHSDRRRQQLTICLIRRLQRQDKSVKHFKIHSLNSCWTDEE